MRPRRRSSSTSSSRCDERAHPDRAEQPASPLSVCTARNASLTSVGIDAALACSDRVEREQVARQRLDDLLRLGEELLARLVASVSAMRPLDGCAARAAASWRAVSSRSASGVNGLAR